MGNECKDNPSEIDTCHAFTLKSYVDDFWTGLRKKIHEQYIMMTFRQTFPHEINQELPDFLTKYLREVIEQRFTHKIEDFVRHFESQNEEKWETYVNEHVSKAKNLIET